MNRVEVLLVSVCVSALSILSAYAIGIYFSSKANRVRAAGFILMAFVADIPMVLSAWFATQLAFFMPWILVWSSLFAFMTLAAFVVGLKAGKSREYLTKAVMAILFLGQSTMVTHHWLDFARLADREAWHQAQNEAVHTQP